MKTDFGKIFSVLLAAELASALALHASEPDDAIESLKLQVQELNQKIQALERQQEAEEVAPARIITSDFPRVVLGASGLTVASPDTNFVFQFRGLLQVDNRTFFNDGGRQGNDTFLVRRARPIFQGTLYQKFDFAFVPDFAGSSVQIFDAYLNYRFHPSIQLRAGKFKTPVGLEYLQSDPVTPFTERSLVTALVPGRDIGFMLWGDCLDGRISYAAGVFNGVGDGRNSSNSDFEDNREFDGRLFTQPFKVADSPLLRGIGAGIAGSWSSVSSNSAGLPSAYQTDGQQPFFTYASGTVADGDHWRLSPQAFYYAGPFSILAEYAVSAQEVRRGVDQTDLRHAAWQVSAGWVLTGEQASFTGVAPQHPFNPSEHHWGALQIVARYSELDIDDDAFPLFADSAASASQAQAWAVGFNWYLNKALRASAGFARTTFTGGGGAGTSTPGAVTRQAEQVLLTRLQMSF